jgi:hypothetical protein
MQRNASDFLAKNFSFLILLCRKWKDIYHAAIASQSYSRYHGFDAAANIPKSGSSTMAKLL